LLDKKEFPRHIECRQATTWQNRGVDLSAALDLMVHDLDLVVQLAPGQADVISAKARSRKDSFGDEVSAELHVGACSVNPFSSRIARLAARHMRIQYESGSVYIDFLARTIEDTRPITVKASFGDDAGFENPASTRSVLLWQISSDMFERETVH
jgi:predicted dehydrogenase